jgi:hypothetical protein
MNFRIIASAAQQHAAISIVTSMTFSSDPLPRVSLIWLLFYPLTYQSLFVFSKGTAMVLSTFE